MSNLKQEILVMVKDDLAAIEVALEQNLNPYLDLISNVARHILFSGGKRLRPLLMVLSARLCGYKGDYDKTFSTVFEYLHAASLLHDDLIDDATMRRGKPVAHSIWGNSAAILVGDFLLARSLSISVKTGNMKVIKTIATITENMSQGEIHQLMRKGELDISEEEYMEVIRRKTAVLFQGACRISAIISAASDEKEEALSDYGYHLGLAFQMADDLLDYTSDTKALGKEVGADLKEGKLTLPVIYSLKAADIKDRNRMEHIIKNKDFSVNDFKTLLKLLLKYKGISYTQKLASDHIEKAKKALSIFDPSETKEILIKVADYALHRKA
ncbi:MAG: polyprenyl synthetase family protein [Thermodesulfobacteriota bacterium]|nr:polyprenyl synthetase family protein [Thermodesulfobacteriota bacterium]